MTALKLNYSSDIVAGVFGLLLAAASYTISSFAYPRLMGRSVSDAVRKGKTIQASTRSMNSVRNWLGFWTISLSALAHFLAFCLEFGIMGYTESAVFEKPAVILGGGRRYSNNHTADGDLFMPSVENLPDLFAAAVEACARPETYGDFKMVKNEYPAIDVSQNASGTYVRDFDSYECTSSWLGSAEWTIEPSGDLIIDLETVTEQYRYEDDLEWNLADDYGNGYTDFLSISYGLGTSYRGDTLPVVLLNISSSSSVFLGAGISVSEEDGHYVYSISRSPDYSSAGGKEVLNGTYMQGHYRSSEYSMGGIVCILLVSSLAPGDSLSSAYAASNAWWQSELVFGDYLIHSNPEGSEQSWPSLSDASGALYVEYVKGTEPIQFPFKIEDEEREATEVSSWCFVLAAILALIVMTLAVASFLWGETEDGFWTYDGLSRMAGSRDNAKSFAVVSIAGGEGSGRIGLVRSENRTA
ncbi:unnamed protein product [Scytosiphon promiscuus]